MSLPDVIGLTFGVAESVEGIVLRVNIFGPELDGEEFIFDVNPSGEHCLITAGGDHFAII